MPSTSENSTTGASNLIESINDACNSIDSIVNRFNQIRGSQYCYKIAKLKKAALREKKKIAAQQEKAAKKASKENIFVFGSSFQAPFSAASSMKPFQ